MTLDAPTLFTCLMVAEFAGSVILFLFYLFWRSSNQPCAQSLLLWSFGLFLAASGTLLIALRGTIPDGLSIVVANVLIFLGTGFRRAGFAVFLRTRGLIAVYIAISMTWVGLCYYPPFMESFLARANFVQAVLIFSSLWVVLMAVAQNSERLYSVRILGLTTLIETTGYLWFSFHQNQNLFPTFQSTFSENFLITYLVIVLFAITMTIVLPVTMVIERSLLHFKEQASQDDLTGLSNRRAFLDGTRDWIAGHRDQKQEYSIIQFELDRFDDVRQKFGGALGDALLQLFSHLLKDASAASAVTGKIADHEFLLFLPAADEEFALLTAQRICRRFGLECQEASEGKLMVTVSVGIVTTNAATSIEPAMEHVANNLGKARRKGRAQIVTSDLAKRETSDGNGARRGLFALKRKAA